MTRRLSTIGLIGGAIAVAAGIAAVAANAQGRRAQGYSYRSGQELYEHICQGCHMPDAKGAEGAGMYPALAGNRKLAAQMYPVLVILRGQKAMPAFAGLDDGQVAAVTNYIRTHFGNAYTGEVSADQVKAMRPRAVEQNAQRPG